MVQFLQSLQTYIPKGLMEAAGNMTGEKETGISTAMNCIVPSVLKGVMVSDSSDHAAIAELLIQAGGNENLLNELKNDIQNGNRSSLGLNNGKHFVHVLFGNKTSGLENLIANHSSIEPSNAHFLLSIGGAVVASFIGKKMSGESLQFNSILSWLHAHRAETDLALPENFAGFLQDKNQHSYATKSEKVQYTEEEEIKNDGTKWVMPILLVGFLAFGIWYWLKGYDQKMPEPIPSVKADSISTLPKDTVVKVMSPIPDSIGEAAEIVDTVTIQDSVSK